MYGEYQGARHDDFNTVANSFTQGLRDLPTDYATRVRNFLAEYLGNSRHPVPFGGRTKEFAYLDAWLADAQETPYLLLTAPAGRGKSALLLRWCQNIFARHDFAIAYFPVSIRFRTNLAGVVYPAIVALLARLHGEKVPIDPNLHEEVWRGLLVDYMTRPLPDGRSLLLVLDGVDEAADWTAGSALFPQAPPAGLRIVLSARSLANDTGVAAWLKRLGWTREGLARTLELYPLDRTGIASVLVQMGFPLDHLSTQVNIVSELHRLSEGDPLLVRLYVDDLWARGEVAIHLLPEDLRAIRPGLSGYFERWWNDQRLLWSDDAPQREVIAQVVLNTLAGALGPLSKEDVLRLVSDKVDFSEETLEQHLTPLARFVTGDGIRQGYVFSHPRLGNYFFEERLSAAERQEVGLRFLTWGEQTLAALNTGQLAPENASAYIVQYYGAHLEHAQANGRALFALASNGWRRAWEKLDRANAGFLGDVERAWHAAERDNLTAYDNGEPIRYLSEEIYCLLIQASVNSLTSNISPRLMLEAVKTSVWTPAQGLACLRLITDLAPRARELVGLAPYIQEPLRTDILQEALDTALTIKDEYARLDTLVELSSGLSEALLWQVLDIVSTIEDEADKAGILVELSPAFSLYPALIERTLVFAQNMAEDEYRALTLEGLSAHLSLDQQERVLQFAKDIDEERDRTLVFSALIAHVSTGLLQQILQEARVMQDSLSRMRLLVKMVPYLSAPLQGEVMQEALELAHNIDDREYILEVLVKLSPFLSDESWPQVLREILQLKDENYQANGLSDLIQYVPAALLPDFLHIVMEIRSEEYRTRVLIQLLPRLSEELLEKILDRISTIWDEGHRSELLAQITLHVPDVLLPRLLTIVSTIQDQGYRVWLMAELDAPLTGRLSGQQFNIANVFYAIPTWEAQLQTLLAVAPRLSDGALMRIFTVMLPEIFGFSWRVRNDEDRALILAKLGNRLPERWLSEAMAAVQQMSNETNQVYVLVAMASRMRGSRLSEALDIVRAMKDREKRAQVLEILISSLPVKSKGKRVQEMLQALQIIRDETERVNFVVTCIPYLPATLPPASMQLMLNVVRAMLDERNKLRILTELASHIPADMFDAVLDILQGMRNKDDQPPILIALAPYMTGHVFSRFFALIQNIQEARWRSQALKIVMPHAPRKVITDMLELLHRTDDEAKLVELLEVLSPYIPEDDFLALWETAHKISNEGSYVLALGALAPYVPEAFFLRFWQTIQDLSNKEWCIWILRTMSIHVAESRYSQLWNEILRISDKAHQIRTLRMLAPYMPTEYFPQLWPVVQAMPANWTRWHVLEALAPRVPKEFFDTFLLQVRIITDEDIRVLLLELLIPRVTEMHFLRLWDVIQEIHTLQHVERLLVALAPYVPDDQMYRLWNAVPGIKDDKRRVQVLSVLFPHLAADEIAESLEMMRDLPMGTIQLQMFEALLPYLSEAQCLEILDSLLPTPPERLADVLMQATWDKHYHMQTLAALVPYLPGKQIVVIVPIVLTALKVLNAEEDRKGIVLQLALNLPAESLEEILDQLLDALKTINVLYQIQVLNAFLPELSPAGWKKVLAWVMRELQATGDTYVAAQIVKSAQALREGSIPNLFYPLMHEILHILSQHTRREALLDLTSLVPVVYGVGGEDAVLKTCSSMLEIGGWWP